MSSTRTKILTPDQVRQRFKLQGITQTEWAKQHGFDRRAVYRVLSGTDKGNFGQAHKIAVALGLKASSGEPITPAHPRNMQDREAA